MTSDIMRAKAAYFRNQENKTKTFLVYWNVLSKVMKKIGPLKRDDNSLAGKIQKFGFINGVYNVNWPPYRDSKS